MISQPTPRSGYHVASTSSPHNFDLVKTYGADIVLDYNDPNCASEIRNRTDGNVYYAFDTPADAESARICAEVLSTDATARQPVYNEIGRASCRERVF